VIPLKQFSLISLETNDARLAIKHAIDPAVHYKEHAAKVGIKIEVVRELDDDFWSEVWMKINLCLWYWIGRLTVDNDRSDFCKEGGKSHSGVKSKIIITEVKCY
jgi:peptide/nickel transport system substrate-binding protein